MAVKNRLHAVLIYPGVSHEICSIRMTTPNANFFFLWILYRSTFFSFDHQSSFPMTAPTARLQPTSRSKGSFVPRVERSLTLHLALGSQRRAQWRWASCVVSLPLGLNLLPGSLIRRDPLLFHGDTYTYLRGQNEPRATLASHPTATARSNGGRRSRR